jgi:hypothetical protein
MRVKIGDQWFDSADVPICLELSVSEQQQIASQPIAPFGRGRYPARPRASNWTKAQLQAWATDYAARA